MSTASKQLRELFSRIPNKALQTRRPIDRDDIRIAIRTAIRISKTREAKKRVRIYSDMGFVPSSYKWRCEIQYVECNRHEDGWKVSVGWTGAQRPRGSGSLIVVQ